VLEQRRRRTIDEFVRIEVKAGQRFHVGEHGFGTFEITVDTAVVLRECQKLCAVQPGADTMKRFRDAACQLYGDLRAHQPEMIVVDGRPARRVDVRALAIAGAVIADLDEPDDRPRPVRRPLGERRQSRDAMTGFVQRGGKLGAHLLFVVLPASRRR
jgi:hypothetical protein